MKTFISIVAAFLLCSCAADHTDISACVTESPSGFWMGLWHGIISPITFIISLFSDNVEVWDTNNNGGWYTFGFLIGVGGLSGSASRSQ